ncbi:MAG: hypothetical protein B7Y39_10145, partial [Bdellovibrio sp. 28-41-41]
MGAYQQDYDASGANVIYDGGAVYVYTRSGTVWSQQQKIVATGTNARVADDSFGYSLSLYGESLAVGAYKQDYNATGMGSASDSGAVYVYTRTGSTWSQQQKIVATGSNARKFYDEFGHCLSLYGETLAVGAHFQNYDATGANVLNNTGAVYVYTRTGSVWSQQQKVVATGTNARAVNDEFGASVALAGDALLVGAPNQYYDSNGMNPVINAGAVYDFKRSGSVWSLNEKLVDTQVVTASRLTNPSALYGATVAHSNDGLTLAVGVSGDTLDVSGQNPLTGAGSVFIYTRSTTASSWVLQQKITAEGLNARMEYDYFGSSVSLSADTLAVGANGQDYDASGANTIYGAGAVYVYTRSGGVWSQQQKIVPEGLNARGYYETFGSKLSLSGDTLAVGVSAHDFDASGNYVEDGGAVFVFSRTGSTWSQQQKIVAEGTNARVDFDYFG